MKIEKVIRYVADRYYGYMGLTTALALSASPVQAAPTLLATQDPTLGDAGGNYLVTLARWFNDGAFIAGAAVTVMSLIGTAWLTFAKVNEARDGRNPTEWSDVLKVGVVGSAASMFAGYLVTQAATVFTTA